MRNLYLFIIWNKALFQRDKILSDLKKSFNIVTNVFVEWSDYDTNLKAFYGSKIESTRDKLSFIGKGEFNLIVVEDRNPLFEKRKTAAGEVSVNSHIFDKKDLYREWTGRDFRVHGSQTSEETRHDLTILLGPDYEKKINNFGYGETVKLDTIAINKPDTAICFERCLYNFNVKFKRIDNNYEIFTTCRLDIERIFGDQLVLDGIGCHLNIYGEAEGDIPEGLCDILVNGIDEYLSLEDKTVFYRENGLEECPVRKDSLRKGEKLTFLKRLKKEFRYIIAHFKYWR